MIDENKQKVISFYRPPITRNQIPERDALSLEDIYNYLLHSKTAKGWTEEIRKTISDGGDPKPLKKSYLDFVTFSGVFDYRSTDESRLKELNKKGLLSPSGYIVVDIDHLSEIGRDLNELRTALLQDSEIGLRLLFVSPSGDGLKLVCKTLWGFTDSDTYESEYLSLIGYLHERYYLPYKDNTHEGLDVTPDITRSCFLCHDDNAVLKDDNSVFNSDLHIHTEDEINSEIKGNLVERPRYQRVQMSGSYDIGYKDKLELFKRDELIPAIFTRIPEIFPSMSFAWSGNSWNSPYKLDGSKPKSPRRDKTRILQNKPFGVMEQGGEAIGVIDYYMQQNGLDFRGAFNELCKICGLTPPAPPQNENNRYNYSFKMKDKENIIQSEKTAQNEEKESKMEKYLRVVTAEDLTTLAKGKREGIETSYEFTRPDEKGELFYLRPGTITMICGKTSQGKSKLLQNLSLQVAEKCNEEESVLYFTLEEELADILFQFANMEIDKTLSHYNTTNTEQIWRYYKEGDTSQIPTEVKQDFNIGLSRFGNIVFGGKLRVYYPETNDIDSLCNVIEFLCQKIKVRAVFIDYVQLLYDNSGRRIERREELKNICEKIFL